MQLFARAFERLFPQPIGPRLERWRAGLAVAAAAPYDGAVYDGFLSMVAAERAARWRKFGQAGDPGAANWWHRHDIDTLACLRNLPSLLEIDVRHGVPSAVFFRPEDEVDGYEWREAKRIIREFAPHGIEFGLHTMCYSYPDPWIRLRHELNTYAESLGAPAEYLTFHGLGKAHAAARAVVQSELPRRMREFGLLFSDCDPALRGYHHVVEDCHLADAQRVLKTDFMSPPPALPGAQFLLLTHPCYWKV